MPKLDQQQLFKDILDSLEDRLRRIDADIRHHEDQRTSALAQIIVIHAQISDLSKSSNRATGSRVKRGSVQTKVLAFVRAHTGQSTAKEIADAIEQNLGSVRSTLMRDERFASDEEGKWHFIEEEVASGEEPDFLRIEDD